MADDNLSGLVVLVKNIQRRLFSWPALGLGIDPDGNPKPVTVDATGALLVSESSTTPTVTVTSANVPASTSGSIPIGSKGWAYVQQTGTATFNGATVGSGFFQSGSNTLAAAIAYTTDSGSTAYVSWET